MLQGTMMKEEPQWENQGENHADERGISEAAVRAGLYADHRVKDELVVGPECLQLPDVAFTICTSNNSAVPSNEREPGLEIAWTEEQLLLQEHSVTVENVSPHDLETSNNGSTLYPSLTSDRPATKPCFSCDRCNDVCLQKLLNGKFSKLTFDDQLKVVSKGRCVPQLQIAQTQGNVTRQFNFKYYERHSWLTGCIHTERLFCFNCVLFGSSVNIWNDKGYVDLKNFHTSAKKHERSERHLEASVKLATFSRTATGLGAQLELDVERHNAKVERNRRIFQRLIDIVCFLGKQELTFRRDGSLNNGNYLELVDLLAKYDGVLNTYLEISSSGLSDHTQNDLTSSVASVLNENIKQQIGESEFVAIMVDETPNREQLVVILRYVHNSEAVDRFIKYVDVSLDQTAASLSSIIIQILEEYDCLSKLIAQTYDGAVLSSDLRSVHALISEKCPQALYVWCSAHILNSILSKSFERLSETKRFFSIIKTLVNFFHSGTKRLAFYNRLADIKKWPRVAEIQWSFHSRLVNVVLSERYHLMALFEEIQENEDNWDGDTLQQASCLLFHLKEFEFNFLLKTFSDIFAESDVLYEALQKTGDIGYCVEKIREFELFMTTYTSTFEVCYTDATEVAGPPKRKRYISDPKVHYKRVFDEIIDNVQSECRHRYSNIEQLKFFELLSNENFSKYSNALPENVLRDLVNTYAGFDFDALKSELRCVYKLPEFRDDNAYSIIQNLYSNNLHNVFRQVFRMAKLIMTFPASIAAGERSFSCLKRIHTYLRNTQAQQRLTDLSLIAIEKELLTDIKRLPTFYDRVLQAYLEKDNRVDLVYK